MYISIILISPRVPDANLPNRKTRLPEAMGGGSDDVADPRQAFWI
jgi:hypothetical protein